MLKITMIKLIVSETDAMISSISPVTLFLLMLLLPEFIAAAKTAMFSVSRITKLNNYISLYFSHK